MRRKRSHTARLVARAAKAVKESQTLRRERSELLRQHLAIRKDYKRAQAASAETDLTLQRLTEEKELQRKRKILGG